MWFSSWTSVVLAGMAILAIQLTRLHPGFLLGGIGAAVVGLALGVFACGLGAERGAKQTVVAGFGAVTNGMVVLLVLLVPASLGVLLHLMTAVWILKGFTA